MIYIYIYNYITNNDNNNSNANTNTNNYHEATPRGRRKAGGDTPSPPTKSFPTRSP